MARNKPERHHEDGENVLEQQGRPASGDDGEEDGGRPVVGRWTGRAAGESVFAEADAGGGGKEKWRHQVDEPEPFEKCVL